MLIIFLSNVYKGAIVHLIDKDIYAIVSKEMQSCILFNHIWSDDSF